MLHLLKDAAKQEQNEPKKKKKHVFVLIVSFSSPLVMLLSLLTHTDYLPLWVDPFRPSLSCLSPLSRSLSPVLVGLASIWGQVVFSLQGFEHGRTQNSLLEWRRSSKVVQVLWFYGLTALPPGTLRLNFIDPFGMTPTGKFKFPGAGEGRY